MIFISWWRGGQNPDSKVNISQRSLKYTRKPSKLHLPMKTMWNDHKAPEKLLNAPRVTMVLSTAVLNVKREFWTYKVQLFYIRITLIFLLKKNVYTIKLIKLI